MVTVFERGRLSWRNSDVFGATQDMKWNTANAQGPRFRKDFFFLAQQRAVSKNVDTVANRPHRVAETLCEHLQRPADKPTGPQSTESSS